MIEILRLTSGKIAVRSPFLSSWKDECRKRGGKWQMIKRSSGDSFEGWVLDGEDREWAEQRLRYWFGTAGEPVARCTLRVEGADLGEWSQYFGLADLGRAPTVTTKSVDGARVWTFLSLPLPLLGAILKEAEAPGGWPHKFSWRVLETVTVEQQAERAARAAQQRQAQAVHAAEQARKIELAEQMHRAEVSSEWGRFLELADQIAPLLSEVELGRLGAKRESALARLRPAHTGTAAELAQAAARAAASLLTPPERELLAALQALPPARTALVLQAAWAAPGAEPAAGAGEADQDARFRLLEVDDE